MKTQFAFKIMMMAQGVLWAALAIFRSLGNLPLPPDFIAILMFADAALFFAFGFLYRKARWLCLFTAFFLAGNLILSLTDQTGALDFIVFGANAASLALLFVSCRHGIE
jgi:hypothetical protein